VGLKADLDAMEKKKKSPLPVIESPASSPQPVGIPTEPSLQNEAKPHVEALPICIKSEYLTIVYGRLLLKSVEKFRFSAKWMRNEG
jgi:hypothetical protein